MFNARLSTVRNMNRLRNCVLVSVHPSGSVTCFLPRFLPGSMGSLGDCFEHDVLFLVFLLLVPESIWLCWLWQVEHLLYYCSTKFVQWFSQSLLWWFWRVVLKRNIMRCYSDLKPNVLLRNCIGSLCSQDLCKWYHTNCGLVMRSTNGLLMYNVIDTTSASIACI